MKSKQHLTEEIVHIRTFQIHGGTIIYVSGLKKADTPCLWFCSLCNCLWYATPNHVLRKKKASGCPDCSKRYRSMLNALSLEEFLRRLEKIWKGAIEYVDGYVGTHKKCKFRCKICGYEWETAPYNLLRKHYEMKIERFGCPECYYASQRISLENMLNSLYIIWGNLIIYLDKYFSMHKKCKWKCAVCGFVWENTPDKLIKRHIGCPHCKKGSMEKPVMEFLRRKNVAFLHNKALKGCYYKTEKNPLRADFYLDCGLVIEGDGKQHMEAIRGEDAFKDIQIRDCIKNEYCKKNNICLIRVTNSSFWGTEKHITLQKLLELIDLGIDEQGNVNMQVFKPFDFNRE